MAGAAKGDCAARRADGPFVQPGNGDLLRHLPEAFQIRRFIFRSGGNRRASSQQLRYRVRPCSTGARVGRSTLLHLLRSAIGTKRR